jgi:hypothetical protein
LAAGMQAYLAHLVPHRHPQAGEFRQFRVGGDKACLFLPQVEEAFGERIGVSFVIHGQSISEAGAAASISALRQEPHIALHRNPCAAT